MANDLTGMAGDLYSALFTVGRELTGFIPAVGSDLSGETKGIGQTVKVPIAPTATASDIVTQMTASDGTDTAVSSVDIELTKAREVSFNWTGEDERTVSTGAGVMTIQSQQIAQAMRTLVNEVETDLANLYFQSSRAYGTAGSGSLFASGVGDLARARQILVDNGCPTGDLQCVMDTGSGANMRSNTQLTKANESGDTSLMRQGVLLDVSNFKLRESGQAAYHSASGATGWQLSAAASEGDETLTIDTGTTDPVAGDTFTIAGDSNTYVVNGYDGTSTVTISSPGLMQDASDNAAVTFNSSYSASVAFDRSAFQLVTRAPAAPASGDLAIDRMIITDDLSGLSFEVAVWPGQRMVKYTLALVWGVGAIQSENSCLLLS